MERSVGYQRRVAVIFNDAHEDENRGNGYNTTQHFMLGDRNRFATTHMIADQMSCEHMFRWR